MAETASSEALIERARRAVVEADIDPTAQSEIARAIVAEAKEVEDDLAGAIALRAQGVCQRLLGHMSLAEELFNQSVELAQRVGDVEVEGEARASRAAVALATGSTDDALHDLDWAVENATGQARAFAVFQRASVWGRSRADEAILAFGQALDEFVVAGNIKLEAHSRANRALLLAYRGECDQADVDLERAAAIYETLGLTWLAATVAHNQGFVAAARGDVVRALRCYHDAERQLLDVQLGAAHIDQSWALLSLGFADRALAFAREAIAELDTIGSVNDAAEAQLCAAYAAELDQQIDAARTHAHAALEMFAAQDRASWVDATRLLSLRLGGDLDPHTARKAEELGARLREEGLRYHSDVAFLTAARATLAEQGAEAALVLLDRLELGDETPVEVRLSKASLRAICHYQAGDDDRLWACHDDAVRLFSHHRDSFGAIDVRAQVGRYMQALHSVGILAARRANDLPNLLSQVLAMRSGALQTPLPKVAPTAEVQALMSRLRATTVTRPDTPADASDLQRQRAELQREIALISNATASQQPSSYVIDPEMLHGRLGGRDLIAFVECDEDLIAVDLMQGQRANERRVGSVEHLRRAGRALTFYMNLLARRDIAPSTRGSAARTLIEIAEKVDRALFGDVFHGAYPIAISPPSWMVSWPWSTLPRLASTPFSITPAIAHDDRPAHPGGRPTFVGGPGIANVTHELSVVASLWPDPVVVQPSDATAAVVLKALEGAVAVHLAVHHTADHRNPLFSSIRLFDGDLFTQELLALQVPPGVVVLAACSSGDSTASPWDEQLGTATALLAARTGPVICSPTLLPDDEETTLFLADVHRELAGGANAARAVTAAVMQRDRATTLASGLGFVVLDLL